MGPSGFGAFLSTANNKDSRLGSGAGPGNRVEGPAMSRCEWIVSYTRRGPVGQVVAVWFKGLTSTWVDDGVGSDPPPWGPNPPNIIWI